MTVRTRRTRRKWLGISIFITLVIISGVALNASGDMQNPFSMFMQASGGEMGERPEGGGMGEMPEGERPERPEGSGERGGGESSQTASLSDLQWDQIGGVLYNLWLMAAASAVIMLVAPVVGMAFKPLRRNRNHKQKLAVQAS